MTNPERPVLHFETRALFREWLVENHSEVDGIWVKLAKKGSTQISVSYEEAVNEGLCFGWIDGQARRLDDDFYLQGFTPRRRRSPWSVSNVRRVEKLTEQGLIEPAGQVEIDRAKADGRWDLAVEEGRAADERKRAASPE
ncbi:YdeI/OmpD-associated family protein [Aldersonia kunmingensis]|uniref:YdeI/OmpD-associated family protein n=1 Tax=Aldersonia kunmingensis TaxID=408066 RepID=UPI0008347939|nr:hypothetical protein [Aldersonia kunmingensis]